MTKVKKVKAVLQLHNKWIRIMLTLSILVIIGLSIYPDNGFYRSEKAADSMPVLEMMSPVISDTVINRDVPIVLHSVQEPIPVQIVKAAEPFDWQGMITWIIGAVNGVVLLVMNLKNIKKK